MCPFLFTWSLSREGYLGHNAFTMRNAISFVIVLWALSHFLNQAFTALNAAVAQSFKTIETAAVVAEQNLIMK